MTKLETQIKDHQYIFWSSLNYKWTLANDMLGRESLLQERGRECPTPGTEPCFDPLDPTNITKWSVAEGDHFVDVPEGDIVIKPGNFISRYLSTNLVISRTDY